MDVSFISRTDVYKIEMNNVSYMVQLIHYDNEEKKIHISTADGIEINRHEHPAIFRNIQRILHNEPGRVF